MLLSKQFLMFLKSNHAFIVQRQALQEHSVTSEKTWIFDNTTVRIWNLMYNQVAQR